MASILLHRQLQLPRQLPLAGVLVVVFVLGCGATLAEPAMGALRNLGSLISYRRAPLLKGRAGAGGRGRDQGQGRALTLTAARPRY